MQKKDIPFSLLISLISLFLFVVYVFNVAKEERQQQQYKRLAKALRGGNVKEIKQSVKQGKFDLKELGVGVEIFFRAVVNNQLDFVQYLLEEAKVITMESLSSPQLQDEFIRWIGKGQKEEIRAEQEKLLANLFGNPLLIFVVIKGSFEMVRYLLEACQIYTSPNQLALLSKLALKFDHDRLRSYLSKRIHNGWIREFTFKGSGEKKVGAQDQPAMQSPWLPRH